ncbi:PRC-barrel domain-containing protein [Shouchella shacheensis]|uniref:PRC-barrel domain-containing protein n=1 Tax=Shouchella shacheensis TaxID=1649580 RepID=UPI00073FB37A|nr:PRC-barrel domain-containing protein [Shouchella shacheensis]
MRTVQALVGLPVIETCTGAECGRVMDGLIEHERITGLIVNKTGMFSHHAFLDLQEVACLGKEAVMIADRHVLGTYSREQRQLHPVLVGKKRFRGKPLLTLEGETLGLVEDVYFNVEVGTIVGYELTDGLLADITEGRKIVRGTDLVIGKERAILSL